MTGRQANDISWSDFFVNKLYIKVYIKCAYVCVCLYIQYIYIYIYIYILIFIIQLCMQIFFCILTFTVGKVKKKK